VKAVFRLFAFLFAVAAFVLVVVDGTAMIAGQRLEYTSVAEIMLRLTEANAIEHWQAKLSRLHPLLWQVFQMTILAAPAVIVAFLLSLLFWIIGRDKEPDLDLRRR